MRRVLVFLVFILMFSACEKEILYGEQGEIGEQGAKGEAGTSAQTHSWEFTVYQNDWYPVNGWDDREVKLPIDYITQDNIDKIVVKVFLMEDRNEYYYWDGYQRELPIKDYGSTPTFISYRTEVGGVVIIYDKGDPTNPPIEDITFKVVIGSTER